MKSHIMHIIKKFSCYVSFLKSNANVKSISVETCVEKDGKIHGDRMPLNWSLKRCKLMQELFADGIYGPKTKAKIEALLK